MANQKNDTLNDIQKSFFNVREKGGSMAANRFDFQKNWAICKILELHVSKEDYLVTLEHHDDVCVFNSSMQIDKVSYYQVKTRKTKHHWTINELIKGKKGKDERSLGSFIGKMYLHLHERESSIETMNFITNIPIQGTLANNNKCEDSEQFCFNDLSKEDLENIETKLKKEFNTQRLKPFQNIMYFKQAGLDIHNHSDTTLGKLTRFVDAYFKSNPFNPKPFYTTIFDEIKTKNNNEYVINDFEELKERSVTRDRFEGYLQDALHRAENTYKKNTDFILSALTTDSVDFRFVKKFKEKSREYEVKQINPNNTLKNLIKKIDAEIKDAELESTSFKSMEKIYSNISLSDAECLIFDTDFIKTVILHRLYE